LIRTNREFLFTVSLLILAITFTSIVPGVAQQAKVGELILDPTHATPGTLVSFKGVGWNLPLVEGPYGDVTCLVDGEPVKIDSHAICNPTRVSGIVEPVGTFLVANVTAGSYEIYITVNMFQYKLVGSKDFTVDAGQPIPELPLPVLVLAVALVVTSLVSTRSKNRLEPS
jgi:hypothetical protein